MLLLIDCASANAELDIFHGEERCIGIAVDTTKVDQVTQRVTTCTDLFGANASLITLAQNESELWYYVISFLSK